MAYMIEISESKMDKMSEYMGKVLKYGSKVMECLDDISNGGYGERRMGYRDEEDYPESEKMQMRGNYGMRHRMGYREEPRIYW